MCGLVVTDCRFDCGKGFCALIDVGTGGGGGGGGDGGGGSSTYRIPAAQMVYVQANVFANASLAMCTERRHSCASEVECASLFTNCTAGTQ